MARPLRLAMKAGIACNEGAFHKFLGVDGKDAAATRLRRMCEIGSRSELDSDPEAARRFQDIMTSYECWLRE